MYKIKIKSKPKVTRFKKMCVENKRQKMHVSCTDRG